MKTRMICLMMTLLLLTGCTAPQQEKKQYQATFLTLFDTVTTIIGYAETEEDFRTQAKQIHDELLTYHQLFDIYNTYEGMNNLKTLNDQAGIAPVQVDEKIIRLLEDCKSYYYTSDGAVNVALGAVLRLWHDARNASLDNPAKASLPDAAALKEAANHTSMDDVIIDAKAGTVFLADAAMSLDVGAVAKGWAVQQVCAAAPEGLLVSVGGNVCATGPKPTQSGPWVIGIQHPDDAQSYLHTVNLTKGCVVTSGDYQRYYVVDGDMYHHIIDPETLYPARRWQSVSIICKDSGAADALSTALFVLSQAEGAKLLEVYDAEALWVDPEGNKQYSPGFMALIRN